MHLQYIFGVNGWHLYFQGYDPLEKEKFIPKYKKKGRSSAGGVERRKKKVAHEDQRVHTVLSISIQTLTQLLHLSLLSSSGSCKVNGYCFLDPWDINLSKTDIALFVICCPPRMLSGGQ